VPDLAFPLALTAIIVCSSHAKRAARFGGRLRRSSRPEHCS